MDPGGSELDSSLPLHENPCLIVEDSQPDGVALEDDPESSYRALLSRRLSHLQPAAHSPVLELIASPAGSRCSQTTDSQSEVALSNCGPALEQESQVINVCPLPNKTKGPPADVDMDSGADSTTHCPQPEEGRSQFAGLELSESQGPVGGGRDGQQQDKEVVSPQTEQERHSKPADQKMSTGSSPDQDFKSARSEVSSSSSSEPCGQTDRALRVQALLHSQGLPAAAGHHGDAEILSSQEDMFDAEKTGAAVDSTVSDNQTHPTLTPAHSLGLLHLSGQDTLVQETLSQNSIDCVAPTPDHFSQAPLIVPNSPTNPECNMDADEPMDTSQPPEDQSMEKEGGTSQTAAFSKPLPKASTPLSQNSPSFVLDRTLSMPSQPEFSHDVFTPTPSLEGGSCVAASQEPPGPAKAVPPSPSLPRDKPAAAPEPPSFTLALQLTVNTESAVERPAEGEGEEDSQDTQIEEHLCVDESQSVLCSQRSEHGAAGAPSSSSSSSSQRKTSAVPAGSQRLSLDRAAGEDSRPSPLKSDTPVGTAAGNVNVAEGGRGAKAENRSCLRPAVDSEAPAERPSNTTPRTSSSQPAVPQTVADGVNVVKGPGNATEPRAAAAAAATGKTPSLQSSQQEGAPSSGSNNNNNNSQKDRETLSGAGGKGEEEEEEESMEEEEEEVTVGQEGSGFGLALSQSQMLSPEPMEEEEEEEEESQGRKDEDVSDGLWKLSERHSQMSQQSKSANSQPAGSKASTNGHQLHSQATDSQVTPDRLSQKDRAGPEADGPKDKSLSDSSGEIPFNFTLPKDGDLIGPAVVATPPLVNQLKQTPRHSTPIEVNSFSEKPPAVGDVSVATSDIVAEESGEEGPEKEVGKLSLRMKLVTPMEEGSSERFSLQKPSLSDEDGSVVKVTPVAKAVTSSSVFSRVRQVHRQVGATEEEVRYTTTTTTPSRNALLTSPMRSSQSSSLGCNSLPNSQSEPSPCPSQELLAEPLARADRGPGTPDRKAGGVTADQEASQTPGPSTPHRPGATPRTAGTPQSCFENTAFRTPSSKRTISQQTSFEGPGLRSPTSRLDAETPSFQRAAAAPSHRRHVRTTQEVRTTVTRVITDVYYEDGKEVERKVTEESEEPVVDCQVLDSDVSPCRTGSSMTSGDLGDVSSLSSKLSGGTTGSGGTFAMPPSRGGRASSPRRGGGPRPRGPRGQRAGSAAPRDRGAGPPVAPALVPLPSRGRARRGRPPSRSSLTRGAAWSAMQRVSGAGGGGGGGGPQHLSSSEEEPPRLPDGALDAQPPSPSGDGRSASPEGPGGSAGSSFVGLRVVAKWSSNAYFYPGRITKAAGEGRFGLRFDDGYECEVAGGDILLCDPVPVGTEVTALLEEEYFSVGVVKGHKTEGQELYYSVEREGQSQWHSRSSVILSLEQGNLLREQHSLGPYEPATPLAKASDISLDNLVEGKRRRRGGAAGQGTPTASSSSSPRTPGPSGKRKLMSTTEERSPAKRGRRGGGGGGGGGRAAQRVGVCNTSGSGTDLPAAPGDVEGTHGPLPQNASLFLGFAFMLTASSETDRLTNKLYSDDEQEYVQTAPYNKGYTESQLQAGGGFVLLDFNEEQCKAAYQSLLIADQHCRTRKYLLCVASGVPCVSHIWVRDCCKENKLLNYRNYLLPAGVGPDEQIVEWHPRCKPFEALRVLLVFGVAEELWVQLLTLSGALTVKHYQAEKDSSDIPAGKFDVVVTDEACPLLVVKSVASQKLPLVSPEWLIQSLICGERLGYHSKPQYHHDYSSSTTTTSSSSTSS